MAEQPPTDMVSVIIPCFRQASTLARAVESVIAQHDACVEIIVVDDGSPDDTAAVARELCRAHPEVRLIRQHNQGVSCARNAGLAQARGTWVHFLDSDDWLLPGMYAAIRAHLVSKPETGLIFTGCEVRDDSGKTLIEYAPPLPDNLARSLAARNMFHACMLWCRREAVLAEQGFVTDMTHCEDWDLWLRLAFGGIQATRVEGCYAVYFKHPPSVESASSSFKVMIAAAYRMLARNEQRFGHQAKYAGYFTASRANARRDFFALYLKPELHELVRRRQYLGYLAALASAGLRGDLDWSRARDEVAARLQGLRNRLSPGGTPTGNHQ